MLKWMKLKNLALVEEADVEFGSGFTAITGETGAGKSVIMGAVGLLLGDRADKSAIRQGANKSEIAAEFRLSDQMDPQVRKILQDAAAESEDEPDVLLIRRVITPTSTRNFINGCPATLQTLKELGTYLIDIHAANENQSLMRTGEQLKILDRFAGLDKLLEQTAQAWEQLQKIRAEKKAFLQTMPSAEETARMRRDAEEIEKAAPVDGEDEELKAKHALASNSRDILEIAGQVSGALKESDDSLYDKVLELRRALMPLERVDEGKAAEFMQKCEGIADGITDLSEELSQYAMSVELDEGEFQAIEDRMRVLQTLKRRYGATLADVLAHFDGIRARIDMYDNAEHKREEYEERERGSRAEHIRLSEELRKKRKDAAGRLIGLLSEETRKLGFAKAEFGIEFEDAEPGANGYDRIQMQFSANPGVPLKPLREVASSGEISRVMLAMKTVLAEADSIPVLIFDEIDANIGGETAMKVGGEIAKLAKTKQVICISHLPQVAHHAAHHFLVTKHTEGEMTLTEIQELDARGRIREIGRMLGGGKAAEAHAKAMLSGTD